jgi:hypothetical protein
MHNTYDGCPYCYFFACTYAILATPFTDAVLPLRADIKGAKLMGEWCLEQYSSGSAKFQGYGSDFQVFCILQHDIFSCANHWGQAWPKKSYVQIFIMPTLIVRCQGTNGPSPMGRLSRPVRVRFRDKIESLLRGQVILSI